ncbi:MAG TPA: SDR family oxidoreductase [Acidimicrobiales bacterium]|jgi:3-oxoacyl-[acyl-carrier protein] reductase
MSATGCLSGRTVLITGAGGGVGRGTALACSAAGANVVIAAPRDNGAETVQLVTAQGGAALWVRCDVTRRAEVQAAVDAAVARFGDLDVCIHNATSRRSSGVVTLEDLDRDLWDEHASVTLRAAYYCAQASFPHLSTHPGQARYILFTSPAGMEGSSNNPPYGMVKAGIRGFVKSLAREWGPFGINVTCVSPLARTPALDIAYKENPVLEERLNGMIPLGRVGDPETDIGPAMAFLASDSSRYITGQTIVVDGGRFITL